MPHLKRPSRLPPFLRSYWTQKKTLLMTWGSERDVQGKEGVGHGCNIQECSLKRPGRYLGCSDTAVLSYKWKLSIYCAAVAVSGWSSPSSLPSTVLLLLFLGGSLSLLSTVYRATVAVPGWSSLLSTTYCYCSCVVYFPLPPSTVPPLLLLSGSIPLYYLLYYCYCDS